MSYGTSIAEAYRQAGVYAGRFSTATSPATCRSSNRPQDRKAVGLAIPPGVADEVIE